MRIVYFGKGERGAICLSAMLQAGYMPGLLVGQPEDGQLRYFAETAQKHGLEFAAPADPNGAEFEAALRRQSWDLFVLGGYGRILKRNIIGIPARMTINLHGGALPHYRGSSPLNWVLIKGEESFSVSIIQVDAGIDTGPILMQSRHPILPHETIVDLHAKANRAFPQMLLAVLRRLESGENAVEAQALNEGGYYPLRFPEDGFILFDQLRAEEVHNRIRALTEPYPCAFSFFQGRKVKLIASELSQQHFFGEPGRIYKKSRKGLLVCARDECLWITKAFFTDNHDALWDAAKKYDALCSVRQFVLNHLETASRR